MYAPSRGRLGLGPNLEAPDPLRAGTLEGRRSSGTGGSTLFCQARKTLNAAKAPLWVEVLLQTSRLGLADLEDAIQAAAALGSGIGVLVTWDATDFRGVAGLRALGPEFASAALGLHATRPEG